MDITLIPISESRYNKKHHKSFLTDGGIERLTDCSLVLLHKSGMRPLFLMQGKDETIVSEPQHRLMAQPDLIVCCNTATGKQSARVIQEQLERCHCHVRILETDFSIIKQTNQPEQLNNLLSTRGAYLEEKGYRHIVVVADSNSLDKIARCINGKRHGLNPNYNVPVYSFSDGQEITDQNLTENLYVTREILDYLLLSELNSNQNSKWCGKCNYPMLPFQLRQRLHFPQKS